jgi:hypothetical protein
MNRGGLRVHYERLRDGIVDELRQLVALLDDSARSDSEARLEIRAALSRLVSSLWSQTLDDLGAPLE